MEFAKGLGWVQTRVILFIIYFLGIAIIAVIAFIFRRDFLDKNLKVAGESFWRKRELETPTPESAKRQF
jgi:Fe2+ transport system protein B